MIDRDLASIQEARDLIRQAQSAQRQFARTTQQEVDRLVNAIVHEMEAQSLMLARMAVEETGFGVVEHKRQKNLLASVKLGEYIRGMKSIGIIEEDKTDKLWLVASPVGTIAALIPSTNPTSTVIYKAIIALKAGNSVVFSPHPSAAGCIGKTVELIRSVLKKEGHSEHLVSVMTTPTLQGTSELMKRADLILATGGPAMVKAAYSSGTPALGVGSGNVPAYIEKSADISQAVSMIIASKTFDNGTVCASEQAIVTESCIAKRVKQELEAQGCCFLTESQVPAVKAIMERANGSMNPAIVGRDAQYIAKLAGIRIPEGTKVLVCQEEGVGSEYPFSKEKLTALLGFYTVDSWKEACELCHRLLKNGGMGHSLAIHSEDKQVIRQFALEKPVSRLLVNTPSTQGAVGLSTNLAPALTLGCGSAGGSSTSDNITPMHLLNIRRVAWDTGAVPVGLVQTETCSSSCEGPSESEQKSDSQEGSKAELPIDAKLITRLVLEEIAKM